MEKNKEKYREIERNGAKWREIGRKREKWGERQKHKERTNERERERETTKQPAMRHIQRKAQSPQQREEKANADGDMVSSIKQFDLIQLTSASVRGLQVLGGAFTRVVILADTIRCHGHNT